MSDPVSLSSLFDAAEQAALHGDYAAAARLLGDAARLQETTLGPDSIDLANTLNNLAVAHERSGDLDAAEREYRRAHDIAAAVRPADDPLVTTSAQNLREFCEANGRPVERIVPVVSPAATPEPGVTDAPTAILPRRDAPAAPAPSIAAPAPSIPAPVAVPRPKPPAPRRDEPAARRLPVPVLVAIAALVALLIWWLVGRRDPPAPQPEAAAPESVPAPPSTPPPSTTATSAPAPTPIAAPRPAAPAVPITIGDARLCTALSSGYDCTVAGQTVAPGRLTFYTRLIAPQNTSVVHRWYRGNELRQAVRLEVPARRQGYRTFSRGTVYVTDGDWRVELRTRDGQLLHTETFQVR